MVALMLISAAAASAQPVTAEEAIATYRDKYNLPRPSRCDDAGDPQEIVVCGRREGSARYRVAFERTAGEPVRGEMPSGMDAMNGADRCMRLCAQPVAVDLIKAVPIVVNAVRRVLGQD